MAYNIICNGSVSSDGGSPLTQVGFCYTGATTPETYGTVIGLPTAVGAFNGTSGSLAAGTNYTIKAFATNSVGTTYSLSSVKKTLGVQNPATISLIASPSFMEFGSITQVTTSCNITPNDETTLKNYLVTTYGFPMPGGPSCPVDLPLPTNPVVQNINLNVPTPPTLIQESIDVPSVATLIFGNPEYTVTQSVTNLAVYPILYIVDTLSTHPITYYNPYETGHGETGGAGEYIPGTFYGEARGGRYGGYSLNNTDQEIIIFKDRNWSIINTYLHLGIPYYYGTLSINGVERTPSPLTGYNVYGDPSGTWTHKYKIYDILWSTLNSNIQLTQLTLQLSFE